jgi:hypothetical protein
MDNSPYLDRPLLPLAVALPQMLGRSRLNSQRRDRSGGGTSTGAPS